MLHLRAASGVNYALSRLGEGEPLLLLHGFTGDRRTWERLVPLLRAYQLIMPDLPGHGSSDSPERAAAWHMSSVAADLISLLDALGLPQVHLLGYSLGGRLALYLALRYPRRFLSLTLESASPGLADDAERQTRRQRDEQLADKIEARGIAWFVDFWESLPMWDSQANLPADVLAAQRNQRLRNDPAGLAGSLRGLGTGAQPSLWEALPEIQLPTLLIVGALDSKFRRINATMRDAIPGARLAIIDDAGHNTHLEKPGEFARVVAAT